MHIRNRTYCRCPLHKWKPKTIINEYTVHTSVHAILRVIRLTLSYPLIDLSFNLDLHLDLKFKTRRIAWKIKGWHLFVTSRWFQHEKSVGRSLWQSIIFRGNEEDEVPKLGRSFLRALCEKEEHDIKGQPVHLDTLFLSSQQTKAVKSVNRWVEWKDMFAESMQHFASMKLQNYVRTDIVRRKFKTFL